MVPRTHPTVWLTRGMTTPRVFWSVTPEQTKSPYIGLIASHIRSAGWTVDQLSLRELWRSSGELVHIQWPEHVSRGAGAMTTVAKHFRALPLLAALRVRKHQVILTAHNRAPHGESDAVDAWFRSQLEALAAAVILLVPGHEDELRTSGALNATATVVTIPHPLSEPSGTPSGGLPGERNLLVVLGQIHPYHQIEEFLDALETAGFDRDILVAGGVGDHELSDRLVERAAKNPRLTVRVGFADEAVLAPYLAQALAVVSLQRNTFNSGGPFFALPQHLPIIMSAGAQADNLAETVGSEWVFPVPVHVNDLDVEALDGWLTSPRTEPALDSFSLEGITTAHIRLYELLRS